jgi:hypothetical protein
VQSNNGGKCGYWDDKVKGDASRDRLVGYEEKEARCYPANQRGYYRRQPVGTALAGRYKKIHDRESGSGARHESVNKAIGRRFQQLRSCFPFHFDGKEREIQFHDAGRERSPHTSVQKELKRLYSIGPLHFVESPKMATETKKTHYP